MPSPSPKATATLFAPAAYWRLPESERARMGCGPGYLGDLIVPDTMWLLSVKSACSVHDYMYRVGEVEFDRELADRVLLNNCVRIITAGSVSKLLLRLRLRRARTYYFFVRAFGGPAFWRGKNKSGEEMEVAIC
jgi:hypothetical protein